MESLHLLPDLLMTKVWMVKLDLKDAYLQIPIYLAHHKFPQFSWEGQTYNFQCLLIGLSSAPRVFRTIIRSVVRFLREAEIWLLIYLDDILTYLTSGEDHPPTTGGSSDPVLPILGLIINREKLWSKCNPWKCWASRSSLFPWQYTSQGRSWGRSGRKFGCYYHRSLWQSKVCQASLAKHQLRHGRSVLPHYTTGHLRAWSTQSSHIQGRNQMVIFSLTFPSKLRKTWVGGPTPQAWSM